MITCDRFQFCVSDRKPHSRAKINNDRRPVCPVAFRWQQHPSLTAFDPAPIHQHVPNPAVQLRHDMPEPSSNNQKLVVRPEGDDGFEGHGDQARDVLAMIREMDSVVGAQVHLQCLARAPVEWDHGDGVCPVGSEVDASFHRRGDGAVNVRDVPKVGAEIAQAISQVTHCCGKRRAPIRDEELHEGDVSEGKVGDLPEEAEEGVARAFSHDTADRDDEEEDEEEEHQRDEGGSPSRETSGADVVFVRSG